jgi:hemoglobin/transferrin/lactoferrin receptor protein
MINLKIKKDEVMKTILFPMRILLVLLFISLNSYSQVITVVDKTNLQPIKNARIYNSGEPAISVTTDSRGKVDISSLKSAALLVFEAEGFQSETYSYSYVENQKFQIGLTEKSYVTDEIVVSTTRFNRNINKEPQRIEILGSNNISFWDQPTTAELLSNTGSILVQKSQMGGGSPVIRGFEANKVLIMIDGVRFNNAIFRGGHLQNVLRIDENILDRVEIIYGPGTSVYGSDALGGVISFYTKKPMLSYNYKPFIQTAAYGRYSSAYIEKTGHVDINAGFKKIAVLGSFTFSDFGDLKQGKYANPFIKNLWDRKFYQGNINNKDTMLVNDNVNKQTPSAYYQYDILGKLLFKQNNTIEHLLNFQFSNTNDVPRYDRLTEINSGTGLFSSAEWYYGPEKRLMGSYELSLSPEKTFFDNAHLILAYQNIEESRHNRNFGSRFRTDRTEKLNVFSGNLDFNKSVDKHQLGWGFEGYYDNVNSQASKVNIYTDSTATASTRYPVDGSNMSSFAAYITDNYTFNKYFNVSAGVRFTYVGLNANFTDTTFFHFPFTKAEQRNNAVTGNLGFVLLPERGWRIALMGSTAFRAPNVDDLAKVFETAAGSGLIIPNNDLKPEKLFSGELTLSKIFSEKIKLEGSAYYSYLTSLIVTDRFQYNGQDSIIYEGELTQVLANQNKNKGYVYGYTLSLNADITDWFTLSSTISYTYGRIKTDTVDYPLDHIPPVFGKTSITFNFPKFRGEVYSLYNGWKNVWDYNILGEDNIQYATDLGMPSWFTLNVKMAYQLTSYFSIEAGCENILDQRYRVFASGISAPGRNFVISLKGKY